MIVPPKDLVKGKLSQKNAEGYWSADRASLVACGREHKALVKFYHDRDAALAGAN